ncbi:hypothetical protein RB813 [Rhodopirellula baltica SH 1]|uniref:Uncharacterized protein n=1 Tax=Rhodopirellula baltica (strain DSM 10527 / NCIMB 13988 / SH1) TaxID=243090 RepID=Q7UY85_RHOBA|nr:hypothetical protein RB813 [Rhodopirellula baltica SH 1]
MRRSGLAEGLVFRGIWGSLSSFQFKDSRGPQNPGHLTVRTIVRVFRHGVARELVPVTVLNALEALSSRAASLYGVATK